MPGCLFCNIVAGTTPAQIVFDNEHVLAFKDIRPAAPVHALVIPKVLVPGIHEATPEHAAVRGQVLLAARDVAAKRGLAAGGYRPVVNQGADAGQSVLHLHCHGLGGRPLAWPPG